MEIEQQGTSSATLCCRLQRRLHQHAAMRSAAARLNADLDAMECDLGAIAQQERSQRLRQPESPSVMPAPAWAPKQKSALSSLLARLHSQPATFADVLVRIGIDDEFADAFANDLMPDCSPVAVLAAVYRLDRDAGRRLTRAVVGRVPVPHLAETVADIVCTDLDLFNESDNDAMAFVGTVCGRILSRTTPGIVPALVARIAAAHDNALEVIFVDWIGTALKQARHMLLLPGLGTIAPRDAVNLIVVADNLAAIATGLGYQSKIVTGLRERWQTTLDAFVEQLQYAAPVGDVAHDCDGAVWTVRAGDIARIAQHADHTTLCVSHPDAYVVLRRATAICDVVPDKVGADLVAFLQRRPQLQECPGASLRQQLETGAAAGIVRRLMAVMQETVPGVLAREDFRPLLVQLLKRYECDDAADAIVSLTLQLEAAREQLRTRTAAVAEAETATAARAALDALQPRLRKLVAARRVVCTEVSEDGAVICRLCRGLIRTRIRQLDALTNVIANDGVARFVRYAIDTSTASPPCHALGRVLDHLARSYTTLGAFRAAFGGPVRMQSLPDESDFDEVVAELSRVGDGVGDDWVRIQVAHAIVSDVVTIGKETERNVAADIIATLAYAIVKGRAERLGVVLTRLGADDILCRSRAYMHTSVAVNALFTMMSGGVTKPSKLHEQTAIEA